MDIVFMNERNFREIGFRSEKNKRGTNVMDRSEK